MDGRATAWLSRPIVRQVARFAVIGLASTAAYALLYVAFRGALAAEPANAAALVVTAVGNTAANRRFTFGVRGAERLGRDHAAGLAAFGIALTITTGAVAGLRLVAPAAGRALELAVLTAANVAATAIRFVLLRAGITGGPRAAAARPAAQA
jgi:putative flippase GtrA